jgi:protoheme IX farnesyltransferase
LLASTLVLFGMHAMGLLYLVCAVALGGALIYLAVRLMREHDTLRTARTLFWYSNLYLALIFAAMVVDRVVIW